jgi:thioredoxin reductase (NADPH)
VVITRHDPGRFIGEMNLLTGQLVYLTARVVEAGEVHRISSTRFRRLMAEDAELSDILLSAFSARRKLLKRVASRSIEIIGNAESAASLALRTYAARLELPHLWLDADSVTGVALMATAALSADDLPAVVVSGAVLRNATPGILAEQLGLSYRALTDSVDLTVIGAGPAGLAAAVYGASEGLSTVLLDSVGPGGQAAASSRIENYLGFPNGLSGADLTSRAVVQALKFGAHLYSPCEVVDLNRSGGQLRVQLSDGSEIKTGTVIIATGAQYRALPLDRWGEFVGAGIYYAATELEARACVDQPVTVVGGANSAGQAAIFMAGRGSTVTVVVRGPDLSASMSWYLVERLLAHPAITIETSSEVTQLRGGHALESISITNNRTGESKDQDCNALFCFIGATPATGWLSDVAVEPSGFISTDVRIKAQDLGADWEQIGRTPLPFETSAPNVFAAGDVRHGSMKRVAAATGEGASAVASVHQALGHLQQVAAAAAAGSHPATG